jgi:hypothetical protein
LAIYVDFECHYRLFDLRTLNLTVARIIPSDDPVLAKVEVQLFTPELILKSRIVKPQFAADEHVAFAPGESLATSGEAFSGRRAAALVSGIDALRS